MACLKVAIFLVFLCSQSAHGLDYSGDLENRFAAAHFEAAKSLNDGDHHLKINDLWLTPKSENCSEHFKCWTGNLEEEMLHSTQLFLGGVHSLLDLVIAVQHHNILVYADCNSTLNTVLSPLFLHKTDYRFYAVPREVLEICGANLQITVKKITKSVLTFGHHAKPLNVMIVADLIPGNNSRSEQKFVTKFHEILKTKDLAPMTESKLSAVVNRFKEHILKMTSSQKYLNRQRRSANNQACSLVRKTVPLTSLTNWVTETAGHQGVMSSGDGLPVYYCSGGCSSAKTFNNIYSDDVESVPLQQQQPHDRYWMVNMKMKRLNIIDKLPPATCVGYQYQVFNILFRLSGGGMQQEYFYYPTNCACV